MAIIGAILGDIAGSQYEYDRPHDLDYEKCELFTDKCSFTDDTVTSLAIKHAIDTGISYTDALRKLCAMYPDCGYGPSFFKWVFTEKPRPYNSFGNGAAMRVSFIGEHFEEPTDVRKNARASALVSHNHKEGVKGAVVTATCVWMAKHHKSREEIFEYVLKEYPSQDYRFSISKELQTLRKEYSWDVTCMTSVPVAMRCFYESSSYESFIRNVFSLDCDTDTLCAIGGGVAEEFYGTTGLDEEKILGRYLDENLLSVLRA